MLNIGSRDYATNFHWLNMHIQTHMLDALQGMTMLYLEFHLYCTLLLIHMMCMKSFFSLSKNTLLSLFRLKFFIESLSYWSHNDP